jgi:hypothetical protein
VARFPPRQGVPWRDPPSRRRDAIHDACRVTHSSDTALQGEEASGGRRGDPLSARRTDPGGMWNTAITSHSAHILVSRYGHICPVFCCTQSAGNLSLISAE